MTRALEFSRPGRSGFFFRALIIVAFVVSGMNAVTPSVQASSLSTFDGSSEGSAAASCWEAKKINPSAESGIYWLQTPAMAAPEQFYCDQETDGGGWVLIGRGRQGWKEMYEGLGAAAEVRSPVKGPEAFAPKQLASSTVDALLNGQSAQTLSDGIRLRRALDVNGNQWQEARFQTSKRERWTWAFSSATPVTTYKFDNLSGSGGTTSSFGSGQGTSRVDTAEAQAQGWTQGWAFGSNIAGTNSNTSYLWSATTGAGNARPFTQMYLRPKLVQADVDFGSIPDTGTPKYEQHSMQSTGAMPTVWGVTGLVSGSGELRTEAQTFAQVGNTVFVGGNFKYVQKNSSGAGRVEQSHVAAFDVNTGEFLPDFKPVFNGQVKELAALPNGLLVAGGEFTEVNGKPTAGIVALDPKTGASSSSWKINMENRLSGGAVSVRSFGIYGEWLYIGGAFTHLTGGTNTSPVYARSAARVSVVDGTADRDWNPAFNGTVLDVEPSKDGSRVYASGYFTSSNGVPTDAAAAIRTGAGAGVETWNWTPSASAHFQFGVAEEGGRVWLGGSEHSLFSFNPSTFERLSSNITRAGGDFQDVTGHEGLIYAGCHCGHWNYTGGTVWPGPGPNWTIADKINLVGIWDASTGDYLPQFNPVIKGRGGYGIWGNFVDSRGVLWSGGDLVSSVRADGSGQWSGGFARFAPNDSTAPSTPAGVKAVSDGNTDTLSWTASSGSPGGYQILRGDRTIATTKATSIEVDHLDGARYFVRAVDEAGNRSASSKVVRATTDTTPVGSIQYIGSAESWKYRFENSAPPADWMATGFDDQSWTTGKAPLGWGSSGIETTLNAEGTKPLSYHLRKTFTVADASTISNLEFETVADDGIVVYLNGVEVLRSNMGTEKIAYNSYATTAPSTGTAQANPVKVTVPGWAVQDGKNTVSVEVHSNYRNTPNSSFDLKLKANLGEQPDPPVTPPETEPVMAIEVGETWKYRFLGSAPADNWVAVDADDTEWSQGKAPLGWGSSTIQTELTAAGTKPLTSYYRKSFTVKDPAAVQEMRITTRADDGIAVYVNGVEVARKNLPTSALSYRTYATAAPRTGTAQNAPVEVTIPASALQAGTNVVAAEVHSNWSATPDSSFELEAELISGKEAQDMMKMGLEKQGLLGQ
ncbi:fibrinogen-like YCDxxxxGGGW domain-containing protein [Glutamicibacter creatinolyticus]|uniref:fibrinogen-like YCDxxxxGGGW domain-containing protein n=1 Tax=Glutamicibacter creatinolyticus TaxID=162496 RepID=UPI0033D007A8